MRLGVPDLLRERGQQPDVEATDGLRLQQASEIDVERLLRDPQPVPQAVREHRPPPVAHGECGIGRAGAVV